jgi:hypothetical protein
MMTIKRGDPRRRHGKSPVDRAARHSCLPSTMLLGCTNVAGYLTMNDDCILVSTQPLAI